MTTIALEKALRSQPFYPFEICCADGSVLTVKSPEMAIYPRNSRTLIVFIEGNAEVIDLLLVVKLRFRGVPIGISASMN